MSSLNKVCLLGHLGRDPEVRNTQTGSKIVNLSVATSESWIDKGSNERKEKTEWHRVVIFDERLADVANRYLRKGSQVYLEGALQTRKWTDKSGQEKYTTEIVLQKFRGELVLLDKGNATNTEETVLNAFGGGDVSYRRAAQAQAPLRSVRDDLDSDIPF